jgi:hypothetical protein
MNQDALLTKKWLCPHIYGYITIDYADQVEREKSVGKKQKGAERCLKTLRGNHPGSHGFQSVGLISLVNRFFVF